MKKGLGFWLLFFSSSFGHRRAIGSASVSAGGLGCCGNRYILGTVLGWSVEYYFLAPDRVKLAMAVSVVVDLMLQCSIVSSEP